MPAKYFAVLKTRKIQGFDVVSPLRLMDNMYKELSKPFDNPSRWAKVAIRQALLYKYASPIRKNMRCPNSIFLQGKSKMDPKLVPLLVKARQFIHGKKLLLSGNAAYNMYMTVGGAHRRVEVRYYKAVSENAHKDIQKLMSKLSSIINPRKLKVTSTVRWEREMNNTTYQISLRSRKGLLPVCVLVQTDECTPYKKFLGEYVVSIDYLKYTLYNDAAFSAKRSEIKNILCLIKYLNKVQNNYYVAQNVNELDDTPFQRFIIQCKGPNENVLKRTFEERWNMRKKRTNEIPAECIDAPKDKCRYPCVWNKEKKKCGGVPKSVYRAGGQ
jgi:hypothetical protein